MSSFVSRPVLSSCAEWNQQQPLRFVHWDLAADWIQFLFITVAFFGLSVHGCPSSSLRRFRRTHRLISAPPVQSRPCGVRSSAPCCSRGGTWRRGPPSWRWLCRTWSASSNGPFFFGPTGFCTASTVSLELPAPERHTEQTLRVVSVRCSGFFTQSPSHAQCKWTKIIFSNFLLQKHFRLLLLICATLPTEWFQQTSTFTHKSICGYCSRWQMHV